MKREYILTSEEKAQKRLKIEQNRSVTDTPTVTVTKCFFSVKNYTHQSLARDSGDDDGRSNGNSGISTRGVRNTMKMSDIGFLKTEPN